MTFKRIFFIACFLFICTSSSQALENDVSKYTLDNGLTVLIEPIPTSPSACFYALVKTGSATEGKLLGSGVTHFMEHMIFKGTPTRGPGKIPQDIQAAGGSVNASTGHDHTIFKIEMPSESFDAGLDVLSDMLMHASIDAEEFKKEKDVVLSELNMYEDSPEFKISKMTYETLYKSHPYRHPIIGYREVLENLTHEEMVRYYKKRYAPNNIVLAVVGNVTPAEAIEKIKNAFAQFSRQPEVTRNLSKEPKQLFSRHVQDEFPTDLTRIDMAFPTVRLLDPDAFALDVLAYVLGQGESSRLYLDLFKDKNLVYSVSTSHYTPVDTGAFEIEVKCDYANQEEVIKNIRKQIDLIKRSGISPKELNKVKKKIQSDYYLNRQSAAAVAYSLAYDEALAGGYQFSSNYVNRISEVTAKDVKAVAQKYLTSEKENLIVLAPLNSFKASDQETAEQEQPEIKKIILDNGLKVLIKEDHRLPIVSMHIVLEGGQLADPKDLPGLCYLTSRVLTKGTKSLSANDIARQMEEQGIRLSAFASKNVLGLDVECLSQDFDAGLKLTKDILMNPAFAQSEISQQKSAIAAQIKSKKDNIFQMASQELKKILFAGHPFQNDIDGNLESLEKITRKDIVNFYKSFRVPSNMIVTVFGDINEAKVISAIKSAFGKMPKAQSVLPQRPLNAISEEIVKDITLDKKQAIVLMGFQGVGVGHADRPGLDVLSAFIGTFGGKMFSEIRDKYGWAYSLGGRSSEYKDEGFIYFYVLTDEVHAKEARQKIQEIIAPIQQGKVTAEELEKIKYHMKKVYLAQLETLGAISTRAALDEIYGLGYDNFTKYPKLIDQITLGDIQSLAQKYLDSNRSVVVFGLPKEE